ncbi:hypothetical protein KJ359_011070 [Pestalotiopsis sp. 9143b]|nr:hypothetical protein KJ359_011070 [Pestalotiopsis sp. 9143b]
MATPPYKPDKKERDWYYHGFSKHPRLIARTGGDRWSEPLYFHPYYFSGSTQLKKRYAIISDEEIISKWSRDLDLALIQALNQSRCRWTRFFPIRIGLEDPERRYGWRKKVTDLTTVLLIAVEEDSLGWEQGIDIALECRRLLQAHGIENVEVEICEGSHNRHAACARLEAQIEPKSSREGERTNEVVSKLLSQTGHPIAYLDRPNGQGTVGLHVKLEGQESKFYGLTCRHVVSHGRKPHESYTISGNSRQYHVQCGNVDFEDIYYELEVAKQDLEETLGSWQKLHDSWEKELQYDPEKAHMKPSKQQTEVRDRLQKEVAYRTKVFDSLQALKDKPSRQIGHLAFLPKGETSSSQLGYLKDWALVELDSEKFTHGPENKVFVGHDFGGIVTRTMTKKGPAHSEARTSGFFKLRLAEPDEEIREPRHVAMRGSTSGLTFGQTSGIGAVLRQSLEDGTSLYFWELLVIPEGDKTYFSKEGDSGSCVFDLEGRVVGLLTGSNDEDLEDAEEGTGIPSNVPITGGISRLWAGKSSPDISFVSPIGWVLRDTEEFTGFPPRLA